MPAAPFPFNSGQVLTAAQMNAIGAYTAYTPVLTATVTNPTLGTGGSQIGFYTTINNLCIGYGAILFGTSGANAGVGLYRISLPLNSTGSEYSIGAGRIRDASSGFLAYVCEFGSPANQTQMNIQYGSGVAFSVGATVPFTFDNNDQIFFQFQYRLP